MDGEYRVELRRHGAEQWTKGSWREAESPRHAALIAAADMLHDEGGVWFAYVYDRQGKDAPVVGTWRVDVEALRWALEEP